MIGRIGNPLGKMLLQTPVYPNQAGD